MTRLLFLPDDETLVVLDSPMTARTLVERVNQGQWTPPAPYTTSNPAVVTATLHTTRQGRTVTSPGICRSIYLRPPSTKSAA
jgi:hypothetical protein